ncbi:MULTISPECIES: LytR/AlgR family response regulator transcription factor [Chitinophagaceae]
MSINLSYIILEDNELDCLHLRRLLHPFPFLRYIATATNATEACSLLASTRPDIFFMDIELPNNPTGLNIAQSIQQHKPLIIFVTSHAEYALEGFQLSALDYILKPATAQRIAEAVKKIENYHTLLQKAKAYETQMEGQYIVIKEGYNKIKLQLRNIQYMEAMQDYTKLVLAHRSYMVNMPLSNFLASLPAGECIRIHRSYAVPISGITALTSKKVMCHNISLPIGKTYRPEMSKLKL